MRISNIQMSLFAEPWAMEQGRLNEFSRQVLDLEPNSFAVMANIAIMGREPKLQMNGHTAVIPISGVLLKTVPGWARYWGLDVTGYDEIRGMLAQAVNDNAVSDIELRIDSPGGQVAGGIETAQSIMAARDIKPVSAHIEDLGASGAYWLASQAQTITAGPNTEVGSIGVYAVMVDYSGLAEEMGIKVHIVRSGPFKGQGVEGAPISEEYLEVEQELIDQMAGNFIDAVAAGRGMDRDKVAELATGRTWLGPAAKKLGLVDSVRSPQPTQQTSKKGSKMPNTADNQADQTNQAEPKAKQPEPVDPEAVAKAATGQERQRCADLKAEFPEDLEFAMEAIEQGWDVQQAKANYCDRLRDARKTEKKSKGAAPIEQQHSGSAGGMDFMSEARAMAKEDGISVTEAMRRVNRDNPELHDSFRSKSAGQRLTIAGGGGRRVAG